MKAFYGFKDGSGDWFLILDTEKCNVCGDCIEACPGNVFEVGEDEFDPFYEKSVAKVKTTERPKIKYTCAPCKPNYGEKPPPCVVTCEPAAISHSEGWKVIQKRK